MATVNEQKKKDMLTGYIGPTQATASQNTAPKTGTATQAGNLQNLMSNFTTAAKQVLQNQQQTKASKPSQYTGLQGVSQNTATQLGQEQQGYNPSVAVQQAQQTLQGVLDQKPQGYESKYDAALNGIIQRIQNPEQFKYSFEGDALFRTLSDRYVQQGKQASMDAMGQAAALNGGYGSSYGQMVGQQTYDQHLLGLYDKGVDLYDRAWERYKYGQDQLMDQFGVLSQADQTDYGRYRDTVGDWQNELNYATNRADTEYDRDYNQYMNELNYWTQMAQAENSDFRMSEQMAETKRQWDMTYEYNKMTDDRKYAYNICTAILANGKMPSKTQLKAAGISEADAKKMMAQAKSSGGGGSSRKSGGTYYYDENTNSYYYLDDNGHPVQVAFQNIPDNGKIIDGKVAQNVIETSKGKQTYDNASGGAGKLDDDNVGGNVKKKKQ